jgi:hypothetical protein
MIKKLALIICLGSSVILNAQIIKSKLDLVGGISAREYFHLGLRYQYNDIMQLGVYVGNDLELKGNQAIKTFCVDNQIHFGKLSFHNNRPAWYLRQGYTFSSNNLGAQETRRYSYIDLSLGREFAISDHFGANADMGMLVQFREYRKTEPPLDTPLQTNWFVMPLLRLQFYYSF